MGAFDVREERETLAARSYLYAMFQGLFGGDPTSDLLSALDADLVREACALTGIGEPRAFNAAVAAVRGGGAGALDSLQSEYTRLFVGPGKLPVMPWESVHTSGNPSLFQRSTLAVRAAYRAEGFVPEGYPRVADDHIALEAGFMSLLSDRAAECCSAGDDVGCQDALAASRMFLVEHLGAWIPSFVEDVVAQVTCPFYAEAALLLGEMMRADGVWLRDRTTLHEK